MRVLLIILLFSPAFLLAQDYQSYIDQSLEGYWAGSIVRTGNSVQNIHGEFVYEGDSLAFYYTIPDWLFEQDMPARAIAANGTVEIDLVYGKARLVLDSTYQEMTGSLGQSIPPLSLHLKKSLRPPRIRVLEEEFTYSRQGAQLNGTLYYPASAEGKLALAIFVHGRGCSTRRYLGYKAKTLAQYGIATLSYDKRGSEASGYSCEASNHQLVTDDLVGISIAMAQHPRIDASRIGFISYSAGGWIAPHAASILGNTAFLISVVGPSTSVKEQQLDGLRAFAKRYNYSENALQEALEYTELTFSKGASEETYSRMMRLLDSAREKGWINWLEASDIPASVEGISDLWVQRFRYDHHSDLKNYQGPLLSLLGAEDDIVPYKIQIDRYLEIFEASGKQNFEIRVLPGAGHSLNHGSQVRNLGFNPIYKTTPYYFKYYRDSYGSMQFMVDFLKQYNLIP